MSTKLVQETQGGHLVFAEGDESEVIADCDDPETARRVVACWNALQGMTTEQIENVTVISGSITQRTKGLIADYEAERDTLRNGNTRLLEALTGLHHVCQLALAGKDGKQYVYFETRAGHFVAASEAMQQAEAAIEAAQ
jgi:hypothetical protein